MFLKYIKIIILRLAKNYILIEVNIISALYRNPLKYFSLSAWKPKEMGQNGRDSAFSLANCLKSTQQWQMANGDGDEGNDGAGNGDDDGDGDWPTSVSARAAVGGLVVVVVVVVQLR